MRLLLILSTLFSTFVLRAQQPWTLERCMQRAQEKNLDLRNAVLDTEQAWLMKDQAYWSFLPNLNGAATHGYNWGKTIDQYTNTFATNRVRTNNFYLSSDVLLFQGGRKHKELKQAAMDEQASIKATEAMKDEVATAVVRAFLNLLGVREQLAAARDQAATTRDQVAVTRDLLDAGRITRGDLLDIQAQLAQEEYDVENLLIQAEQAKLTLAQLMQMTPAEMQGMEIEAPAMPGLHLMEPSATEDEILEKVLASNPAYAQVQLSLQSAGYKVAISRLDGWPMLSLNGSLGTGYSGRNLEPVGSPQPAEPILIGATGDGSPVYAPNYTQATRVKSLGQQLNDNLNESVGLTLSLPIFNNRKNNYGIRVMRIQEEQAKNAVLRMRNTLQTDVQNALTAQRGAYRQYVSASLAVDAAEEALRMANERFTQQAITVTDLNQAKSRLQQSRSQLINAKYSYLMAEKALDILQGLPVVL